MAGLSAPHGTLSSVTPTWQLQGNTEHFLVAGDGFGILTRKEAASLHLHTGKLYTCRSSKPALLSADEDEHLVIAASEPLTRHSGWRAVPNNSTVAVEYAG